MTQFRCLDPEWPPIHDAAIRAEATVHAGPRTACFYARRALELAVAWAFKHDASLKLPYQDNVSALIHEPSFKLTAGEAIFSKGECGFVDYVLWGDDGKPLGLVEAKRTRATRG